jgi:chromosome segregation protein
MGWVDEFISVPDELKPVCRLLLSRTALVKPEYATVVFEQLPPLYSVVTPEGELFRDKAIISGGSPNEVSLLGRKDRIAEHDQIISDLKTDLSNLKDSKNQVTIQIGSCQASRETTIISLETATEEFTVLEKKSTSLGFEFKAIENELNRLKSESASLSDKLENLRNRQYDLNLSHDQLAREKQDHAEILGKYNEDLSRIENEAEEAERKLSVLQIRLVEYKSKKQQLESRRNHTRELINDIDQNASARAEEIASAEEESAKARDKMAILEIELKKTFDDRTRLSESMTGRRETREEMQNEIDKREKDVKTFRQKREETGTGLHDIEIRITEVESEIRNISQRLSEEYGIESDQVKSENPDASIPEEKRQVRVNELKDLLKNMGAVNLLALEEYQEANSRKEFLTSQLNDLLNAKSTLQSTITKINATARKLFLETFESVRNSFQKVFEELFTGGEADIRLTDPNDPLESPIEIIARPRGKKLLSIAQMSGGERALTAISLLFAIYLAKPSPFCILDEVDAPLDDANINRFLKLIKTFSDETQFIIITHNKITMEAADVLYGITMENPGVSKVVSVRFNDDEHADGPVDTSIGDLHYTDQTDIPDSIKKRLRGDVEVGYDKTNPE